MNFTYTVIKPPDGEYGVIQPDGTWSGMVKLLANQDIDIATATFAVSQERSTVMTFGSPILDLYFSLFIKNPADNFNIMAYIEELARSRAHGANHSPPASCWRPLRAKFDV